MKTNKVILDTMERCYAASNLKIDESTYAVMASEAIGGPCYSYNIQDLTKREVIWEKAGGTMSLIQIPERNGEFLAVQNFFPGFKSAGAKLVWGRRDHSERVWMIKDLAALPFVHRFDIFNVNGQNFILAAVLCGSKKNREDWSDPGKVYIGRLPDSPENGVEFTPILDGLCKNHGYCRGYYENRECGYVTCENGIFAILPPIAKIGGWEIRQIMDRPVGDVAFTDLDGCGTDEMAVIEPFHGDKVKIFKIIGKQYQEVYSYPKEIQFAHAITGCTLRGVPSIVVGIRRLNSELFFIQCVDTVNQTYEATLIENGVGPSNICVINEPDRDIILSANHSKNEAAAYIITD
ncbi:MAG: hypothetical protein LBQ68_03620 [Clostridiales bacterium]|jgi:hypothetical protein|nr:hypothetical protein [Clostridiales bacterium]